MPQTFSPAKTLCIIGKSSQGPVLEPYYADGSRTVSQTMSDLGTSDDVRTVFGHGDLVDFFFQCREIGVEHLHLIRINPGTDLDEFKQIIEAYEIADSINSDLIIPTTVNIDDFVYEYDDYRLITQQFTLEKETDKIKLNNEPNVIKSFKLNDENVYNYFIEGKYIGLPYNVPEGTNIFVKYYVPKEMEVEFSIVARTKNDVLEKVELVRDFDPIEDEFITEKDAIEFFDRTITDDIEFYVRSEYGYIDMYVDKNGKSRVNATLKEEEYTRQSMTKVNIYDEIASKSKEAGAITIFKPPAEEDYIKFSEDIRNRDKELLRYSMCPVTKGSGEFANNIGVIIGANIVTRNSNISVTNKQLIGLESFSNEHLDKKPDDYINAGYLYIDQTIRNGNVLLKARTFDDSVFEDLKVIRTALDLKRVLDMRIVDDILGKPSTRYNRLRGIYIQTLEEFQDDRKITDYSINFESKRLTHLSVNILREIDLVENNIITGGL